MGKGKKTSPEHRAFYRTISERQGKEKGGNYSRFLDLRDEMSRKGKFIPKKNKADKWFPEAEDRRDWLQMAERNLGAV